MSEQQFSAITIKALMRHYQVKLEPGGDGSYSGEIPICRVPTGKTETQCRRRELVIRREIYTGMRRPSGIYHVHGGSDARKSFRTAAQRLSNTAQTRTHTRGGLDHATHTASRT